MRVAVIGTRNLNVKIEKYLPDNMTELISGGMKGVDMLAEKYADEHNIPKLIVNPEYSRYGIIAPILRNRLIIDISDMIVIIWDGKDRHIKDAINYSNYVNKEIIVYKIRSRKKLREGNISCE